MESHTAIYELGKTRGRTAETQARGMDSTSTTVPPVHGLSTGTRPNNMQGRAVMGRLRSAALRRPLSAENSEDSDNFIDEGMASTHEREVFVSDGAAAGAVHVHDSFMGPMPQPGSELAAALVDARIRESGQVERLQPSSSAQHVQVQRHVEDRVYYGNEQSPRRPTGRVLGNVTGFFVASAGARAGGNPGEESPRSRTGLESDSQRAEGTTAAASASSGSRPTDPQTARSLAPALGGKFRRL